MSAMVAGSSIHPDGLPAESESLRLSCACTHCGLPCRGVAPDRMKAPEPIFCCAGCRLVYDLLDHEGAAEAVSRTLLRIGLGIFLTMNVMAFSFPFYGQDLLHPAATALSSGEEALGQVFRWFILIIATAVIFLLGQPIARDAFEHLRRGRIQSTLLITIGVSAAYLLSVAAVLRGSGAIYFDSACMVVTLVTIGYYIEGRMKLRAVNAATGKLADLPADALVEREGAEIEIAAEEVVVGEVVLIREGTALPVDGMVVGGSGAVTEASITGEALPRTIAINDQVFAGSVLVEGHLRLTAEKTGSARRIEQIVQLLTESRLTPPKIQRLTDRVSAFFVPAALLIALGTLMMQGMAGNWAEGVLRALAVALIACPCALGLAAPLATWNAVRNLARAQIVVRSGRALELGAAVRQLFIDKTGTLTDGQFQIKRVQLVALNSRPLTLVEAGEDAQIAEYFQIIGGLEAHAMHPIAVALRAATTTAAVALEVEPSVIPGLGVHGEYGKTSYAVGRPGLLIGEAAIPGRLLEEFADLHPIVFWQDEEPVLLIGLAESVRPEASAVLRELKALGIVVTILTGDTSQPAVAVARELGVPIETGLLPDEKRRRIIDARTIAADPIAYVGDGINDAPALAEADLGVAVWNGADLAKVSGDVVFLSDDLGHLTQLIRTARKTRQRIVTSLIWMFSYNILGFTLACTGTLTPVYAALAMLFSSTFIIWNSARGWGQSSTPEED